MSPLIPEIETARLRLRGYTPDDLDHLSSIRADSVVMRYIGTGLPQDEVQSGAWLEKHRVRWEQHDFGMWAVALKGDETLLGWCGLALLDDTPEVEVGYGFSKASWGKGIATEAARASLRFSFEERNLDRIVAVAMPENTGSQRVMEKIGMKYVKRAHYYGADVVYYAITRDEFRPTVARYILRRPEVDGQGGR